MDYGYGAARRARSHRTERLFRGMDHQRKHSGYWVHLRPFREAAVDSRAQGVRRVPGSLIKAYVAVFRNVEDGSFATSIDGSGNRRGGKFARGQAWALEGLAPAAAVLDSAELDSVVEGVVNVLLSSQMKDGGWAYNISHPLMGQDCKGVPVIAKALAEWGASHSDASAVAAAKGALNWSRAHTLLNGPGAGGIYSFCLEGCVTHHLYSEAAFTYASSYALETMAILERVGVDR